LSINNELQSCSISTLTGKLLFKTAYALGGPSSDSFLHPSGEMFIWGTSGGVTLWPLDKSSGNLVVQQGASSISMTPPLMKLDPQGKLMFSSDYYGPGQFSQINVFEIDEVAKKISLKKNATTVYDFISGGDVSPDSKFLVVSQREKKLLTSFLINRESGEL